MPGDLAGATFEFDLRFDELVVATSADLAGATAALSVGDPIPDSATIVESPGFTTPFDGPDDGENVVVDGTTYIADYTDTGLVLTTGMTNLQIADSLYISVDGVKRHVSALLQRTQLRNRAELVAHALRRP